MCNRYLCPYQSDLIWYSLLPIHLVLPPQLPNHPPYHSRAWDSSPSPELASSAATAPRLSLIGPLLSFSPSSPPARHNIPQTSLTESLRQHTTPHPPPYRPSLHSRHHCRLLGSHLPSPYACRPDIAAFGTSRSSCLPRPCLAARDNPLPAWPSIHPHNANNGCITTTRRRRRRRARAISPDKAHKMGHTARLRQERHAEAQEHLQSPTRSHGQHEGEARICIQRSEGFRA